MLSSVGRLCLVIVGSLVVAGCGGRVAAKNVAVFKVTGTVTYQGKPLPQAIVTFSPKERQPVAFGTTNDKGEFTLTTYNTDDGAAAGSYGVVVSKAGSSGATTAGESTDAGHSADGSAVPEAGHDASSSPTSASLIPADYSDATKTPLKATVDPSAENKFAFEIKE
ncbi:MAG TPA: carboxypeptidase-like regulatory domain-containing protein [Planctomycetaceae bacterium]|jgi:hypothetical protein